MKNSEDVPTYLWKAVFWFKETPIFSATGRHLLLLLLNPFAHFQASNDGAKHILATKVGISKCKLWTLVHLHTLLNQCLSALPIMSLNDLGNPRNVDSCFRTIVVCMCMFWSVHTRPFSLEPPCHADSSLPWHPAQSDAALMAMKVCRDMTKHVRLSVHYFFWGSQLCLCHLLVPLGKQVVEHLVAGRGNLSYWIHFRDTLSEWNPARSDLQNSPLLGVSLQPRGQHRYKLNSHSPKLSIFQFQKGLNCGLARNHPSQGTPPLLGVVSIMGQQKKLFIVPLLCLEAREKSSSEARYHRPNFNRSIYLEILQYLIPTISQWHAFSVLSMPASWLSKPILSSFKRFTMACGKEHWRGNLPLFLVVLGQILFW